MKKEKGGTKPRGGGDHDDDDDDDDDEGNRTINQKNTWVKNPNLVPGQKQAARHSREDSEVSTQSPLAWEAQDKSGELPGPRTTHAEASG